MALQLVYLIFIRLLSAPALLVRSDISKDAVDTDIKITRRDRLGGLIHEYFQVA